MNDLKETIAKTEYLAGFISDVRRERMEEVLAQRTRYLTIVLEDIYHSPNASAVIRSCECFGIQDLHIIENTKKYSPNADVVQGASKWINMHRYRQKKDGQAGAHVLQRENGQPEAVTQQNKKDNTANCLSELKKAGFKIIATTLREGKTISPEDLPMTSPLAICFGTEELGVSDTIYEMADLQLKIPMYGFTESFNISVAVALCLQTFTARLRNSQIPWQLTEAEKNALRFEWYRKSVRNADRILKRWQAQ